MALKLGEESELKIALEEDGTIILDLQTIVEFPLASLVILMPNEECSTQTFQSNVVVNDYSKQPNKLCTGPHGGSCSCMFVLIHTCDYDNHCMHTIEM